MKSKRLLLYSIILLAISADQALKLWMHANFRIGEVLEIIPGFFNLCYVENDGMAFGIEWFDKLALTLFRLVAVVVLGWYAHRLVVDERTKMGYLAAIALIIAGAAGNIIDCVCYGQLFGYANWFYGRVIDMFSFSIFPPVFNIADSCITCAVAIILIWYRNELDSSLH